MKTRWLTFVLMLCLLTSGYAGTVTPRLHLVCRFTGQPMTPVLQTAPNAAKTAPCCHVRVSPPASPMQSEPTFALAPGSCCVLHVTASSGPLPLSDTPPSFFHTPLAVVPVLRLTVPQPYFTESVPVVLFAGRVVPPRAPPAHSALGRAPPVHDFS